MALVSSQAPPPSPYDTSMTYPRSASDLENVRPSSNPAGIPGSRRSSSHGTTGSTYASAGVTSSRTTATRTVPGRSPSAPPFLEVKARSQSTPATSTLVHSAPANLPPPAPYSRPIRTSSPSHHYTQSAGASLEAYPPRSSSAAGSHGPPTPQQLQQQHHHYAQQQQQQFQFPSQPSLGFQPDSHQFAHAQYPYAQNQAYGPGGYVAGYAGLHQAQQQQQHQAMMLQQAQFQQQQWQMEMMRNQQAAAGHEWGSQQGPPQDGSTRRRATSGPAAQPPQSQQYLPYPPSPAPSYSQPGLPPMMAPQFTNGYPTPPGSVEGREQVPSTGYHPYRRGHTNSPDSSKGHQQSSRTPPSMSQQQSRTSSSSMSSAPSSSSHNSASTAPTSRGGDSTTSLSTTEFPPLSKPTAAPNSSSPATQQSMRPPPLREPPRSNSPSPSPSFVVPRPRTDSQNSTSSSVERTRTSLKPEESVKANSHSPSSSISTLATGKKPSPLSQQVASSSRAGTAASTRSAAASTRSATPTLSTPRASMVFADDDEGEDSDDTALGTSAPLAKEKRGIKHKFKKAFSLSPSSQNLTLTEAEMDGRGAKDTGRRVRSDSTSSADTSPAIVAASSSKPPVVRRGLFSAKNNASTDNISISSTVSSASVMIRKLGQLGKLARRNSLMSLTKAFKGSSSKDDEDKSSKKDKTKGAPAVANVSHVTAENESSPLPPGISPAAALAKRHQQQYADQEAAAKLAQPPSFAVHVRTGSMASEAPSTSSKGRLGWGRTKSTEDLSESVSSKKGKKWGFGGGKDDNGSISNRNSISLAFSSADVGQPLEILSPSTVQRHEIFDSQGEELQSPVPLYADDEYEPSLIGSAPLGPRRDARAVRGILKGAGTYDQEDYAMPRPGFPRHRADSFNTPQQISPQDSHGGMITSGAPQLDGLVHPSPSVSRAESPSSYISPNDSRTNPYSNPNMNKSAPTLRSSTSLRPVRNQSAPGGLGRHIVFAQNLSVHTTWPAEVYDRSAEPATCNRLTPQLAQRIKEELNAYKMEEMEVHPTSRQLTHFFV